MSDARGQRVSDFGLGRWLSGVAPARARGVVGVVLTGDGHVRELNHRYRGDDHATDVLSFPAREAGASRREVRSGGPLGDAYLGDIVIARGVARRQARASGHSGETEWRVLALHGLLHLLGYDHNTDDGTMARVERRLRTKGGL